MRQQQFDFERAMNHGAGLFQVHAPPMEPNEDYKGARRTYSRIDQEEPCGKGEIHASESTSESLERYCLQLCCRLQKCHIGMEDSVRDGSIGEQ